MVVLHGKQESVGRTFSKYVVVLGLVLVFRVRVRVKVMVRVKLMVTVVVCVGVGLGGCSLWCSRDAREAGG